MPPVRTILTALTLSTPTITAAQAPPILAPSDIVYVTESRSPLVSGFLEFSFPMVGYVWAGDWKRGVLPSSIRLGGVVLMLAGWNAEDGTATATGIIAAFTGTIWAIVGAGVTAAERNARPARRGSGMAMTPLPDRRVGIGYRLRP